MPRVSVLLENIRSAYNVGSIFRICDGAKVDKLYLTGLCAYPPHPRVEKTALGSQQHVPWEYHESAQIILKRLSSKMHIVSLEVTPESVNLFETDFDENQEVCLIFGNEVDGVSAETLARSHQICHLPMLGTKSSLNVSTCAAVAIYETQRKLGSLV